MIPHYYKNGAKLKEGVQLPFVSFGRLALTNSNSGATTECLNAIAGYDENPVGGGAGKDVTSAFDAYDCHNTECEDAGGKSGVIFENEVEPGPAASLQWPGQLTERTAGSVTLTITNARVYVHCQFDYFPATESQVKEGSFKGDNDRVSVEYNLPGSTVCTTASPGVLEAAELSGGSFSKPAKSEFGGGAGLECGAGGKAIVTGKVSTVGYEPEGNLPSVIQTRP